MCTSGAGLLEAAYSHTRRDHNTGKPMLLEKFPAPCMLQACEICVAESMRGGCSSLILHSMVAGSGHAGLAYLNGTLGCSNVLLLICRSCHLAESKLDLHHERDCCGFAAIFG